MPAGALAAKPIHVPGKSGGTGAGIAVTGVVEEATPPEEEERVPLMRYGPTPRSDSFSIKTSSGHHLAYATCTMFKYLVSAGVVAWCKPHSAYHCDEPVRLRRTMKFFRESGIH